MDNPIGENTGVHIQFKTLIFIMGVVITLMTQWFLLDTRVRQLETTAEINRSQVEENTEFRIRWPRGELGALPDDAEQNLRIEYMQREIEKLEAEIEELKDKHQ